MGAVGVCPQRERFVPVPHVGIALGLLIAFGIVMNGRAQAQPGAQAPGDGSAWYELGPPARAKFALLSPPGQAYVYAIGGGAAEIWRHSSNERDGWVLMHDVGDVPADEPVLTRYDRSIRAFVVVCRSGTYHIAFTPSPHGTRALPIPAGRPMTASANGRQCFYYSAPGGSDPGGVLLKYDTASPQLQIITDAQGSMYGPNVRPAEMGFDEKNQRVTLYDLSGVNWTFDLLAGTWSAADGPSPFEQGAVVYDEPRRRQLFAMGSLGTEGGFPVSMVQMVPLDGTPGRWISTEAPVRGHAATLDATGRNLIVGGGSDEFSCSASYPSVRLWAVDLETGARTDLGGSPAGPEARAGFGLVYDSNRDRLLRLFGDATTNPSYCWGVGHHPFETRVTLTSVDELRMDRVNGWAKIETGAGPAPMTRAAYAFDAGGDRVLCFGGDRREQWGLPADLTSETWALALAAPAHWERLDDGVAVPPAGSEGAMVVDPRTGAAWLFGGRTDTGASGELWRFEPGAPGSRGAWTRVSTTGPAARAQAGLVVDPARGRLVLVGGVGASGVLSDVWTYDLAGATGWTLRSTSGTGVPSGAVQAIRDEEGNQLVVTQLGAASNGACAALDLASLAWRPLPFASPGTSAFARMAYDSRRGRAVLVHAGDREGTPLDWSKKVEALQLGSRLAGAPPAARPRGGLALGPPRPNPARGATEVPVVLDTGAQLSVEVLDLLGRHVRTLAAGEWPAGAHVFRWDGRRDDGAAAAPGLYVLLARSGTGTATQRVVRLR